jgi:PAS domain-containing protein/GAF domain-containing protein
MMPNLLSRFLFRTLRGRLIIGVAGVHAVMMALFIGDLTLRQRAMLLDRQTEEASAISKSLSTSAAGWFEADDIAGLQELVEAQRSYPEVLFAMLANEQGRVLADTDRSRRGRYLLDLPREARGAVLSRTPALVDIATPAMIAGRHVGWARIGIGQKAAGDKLSEIIRDGVAYALTAIFLGSAIAWFMGRRITRRLYLVQETIDAVRSGNPLARSAIAGADEAAVLAREFNSMLDALAEQGSALRDSEERFRSLIRKVQAAIVLHDGQGRILDCNLLAQELLGLSVEELLGRSLLDSGRLFLRQDGSVLPADEYPVSLVLCTRQPLRDQVLGIGRPNRAEVAWLLVNAEPEYDEAGGIALVIFSFVDITERRQAEETMHRLNRELRAISNCNQVLVRAEDEQTLLDEICRIVCDDAGYRLTWIGYAEHDDAKTVRPVAWAGFDRWYVENAKLSWADDTPQGQGPGGTAIRSGEVIYVQDFTTDLRMAPWRACALQQGYRSAIALPLKDESAQPFGTLLIYSVDVNAFTPDEIRLMEKLAIDLAFGITALRNRIERKHVEEALRLQAVDLEQEVVERQLAHETLQSQALLLENEIEERSKAQEDLVQLNETLDRRVKERTAELEDKNEELERFNKLFVGRELRMVQLKAQITALEDKTV